MRRIVITGMGIYSCIGKNLSEVTDSLYNGKSGIGIDPQRKEMGYLSALTGLLERPDLKKILDRRKRLCLPEQGEYAYLASVEAFKNAGIDEAFLEANEVGGSMEMIVALHRLLMLWILSGKRRIPFW